MRRDLKLLKLANLEEILDASFLVINGNRPKQKVQLLERYCTSCFYLLVIYIYSFDFEPIFIKTLISTSQSSVGSVKIQALNFSMGSIGAWEVVFNLFISA